ncbi:MAG: GDSL-type esterase/lipase family protein [Thiohalocapsa sp.]
MASGAARAQLACGRFSDEALPAPIPRTAASAVKRFEAIKHAVVSEPYRILFLGDSITQRYDSEVWRRDMAPRGVLNAGVNGDRTEHLLWRLEHGNLAGPSPQGLIIQIGTNDLTGGGHPRPPHLVADGIRADLLYLRQHVPNARILLLGLYPRADVPRLSSRVPAVNDLIRRCGDGRAVVYAEVGDVLLDPNGHLTREVAPDLLHPSRLGYERLAPRLDALIDNLVAGR